MSFELGALPRATVHDSFDAYAAMPPDGGCQAKIGRSVNTAALFGAVVARISPQAGRKSR